MRRRVIASKYGLEHFGWIPQISFQRLISRVWSASFDLAAFEVGSRPPFCSGKTSGLVVVVLFSCHFALLLEKSELRTSSLWV